MAFNIMSVISIIESAPGIITSGMKLIDEIVAGYEQGVADGGSPQVVIRDILAALTANKGAVATAILGKEPPVTTAGAPISVPKK